MRPSIPRRPMTTGKRGEIVVRKRDEERGRDGLWIEGVKRRVDNLHWESALNVADRKAVRKEKKTRRMRNPVITSREKETIGVIRSSSSE